MKSLERKVGVRRDTENEVQNSVELFCGQAIEEFNTLLPENDPRVKVRLENIEGKRKDFADRLRGFRNQIARQITGPDPYKKVSKRQLKLLSKVNQLPMTTHEASVKAAFAKR